MELQMDRARVPWTNLSCSHYRSMLLKMTRRQVPTSERMAAHKSGRPAKASAMMAALVTTDMTMSGRPCDGILRTSLDMRVTWLVSMAMADPDIPMEMPTSAAASAGAVPVLSKATTLVLARASRMSPPLTSTPLLAAFVRAQKVATGVESTSAQGHAHTRRTSDMRSQCFTLSALAAVGTTATRAAASTTAATRTDPSIMSAESQPPRQVPPAEGNSLWEPHRGCSTWRRSQ
ncbi:unnamed protein product [Spirodela intermedia]|uniref:Uncharacterized protein n=1 Tax=Spirodela intermedia TaxID=51605 RepID=A0ABN7E8G1_SPIIN|nr:unnamed protein product [Spirodela intermedia]